MKTNLRKIWIISMFMILMPQLRAETEYYVIDLNHEHYTSSTIIDVAQLLEEQNGIESAGLKIDEFVLVAKSKGGNAKASLRLGNNRGTQTVIPQSIGGFNSTDADTYSEVALDLPNSGLVDDDGIIQVNLNGNIKISEILVFAESRSSGGDDGVVIPLDGSSYENTSINLKSVIQNQGVRVSGKKIERVYLLAKSRNNDGQVELEINNGFSDAIDVPGNRRNYRNNDISSFHEIELENPNPNSNGTAWSLNILGQIKIFNIIVILKDANTPPPPPPPPVVQPVTAVPNVFSTLVSNTDVNLEWSPAQHADRYIINFRSGTGFTSQLTSSTPFIKLSTVTTTESYITVQGCNSIGCGPAANVSVPRIRVGYTPVVLQSPRISSTQFGLVWNDVPGAVNYLVLASHRAGSLPNTVVNQAWAIIDAQTSIDHFFSVFACNQAGCSNPAALGPVRL